VLVAIDMSKHRQEVLIERPEGGRRRRMTIMATKADYDRLADELSSIGRPRPASRRPVPSRRWRIGCSLRAATDFVGCLVAPPGGVSHNGWDKNDPQGCAGDPAYAADRCHPCSSIRWPPGLQEMSPTHEAISKAKTQTWHRILTLSAAFPEIEWLAGNSRSDWFLACSNAFQLRPA
jgi:hypothetical protein